VQFETSEKIKKIILNEVKNLVFNSFEMFRFAQHDSLGNISEVSISDSGPGLGAAD
jgi:hypothetical protein